MDLPNGVFEIKLDRADIYKISPYKPGYLGKKSASRCQYILTQSDILIYEMIFSPPLEAETKNEVNNIYFLNGAHLQSWRNLSRR